MLVIVSIGECLHLSWENYNWIVYDDDDDDDNEMKQPHILHSTGRASGVMIELIY